jgi:putative transposase
VLEEAIEKHGRPEIFNTDQGAQFTSEAFARRLKEEGIQISTDRKRRGADNVFVDRLGRSLKYKHIYLHGYEALGEARRKIGSYFEFYRSRGPHSSSESNTPDQVYFNLPPLARAA